MDTQNQYNTEKKNSFTIDEQKQKLYNSIYFLTEASRELQGINSLMGLSLLAQADVILAHLKYLETGKLEFRTNTNNQNKPKGQSFIPDVAPVPKEVQDEIDQLANTLSNTNDLE